MSDDDEDALIEQDHRHLGDGRPSLAGRLVPAHRHPSVLVALEDRPEPT